VVKEGENGEPGEEESESKRAGGRNHPKNIAEAASQMSACAPARTGLVPIPRYKSVIGLGSIGANSLRLKD
jgi:hypothetical protein